MGYIIAAILGALGIGAIVWQRNRIQTDESLLNVLPTKEQLNNMMQDVSKDKGVLQSEQEKRDDADKKTSEEVNKDVSIDDLKNFFNDPGNL